MLRNSLYKFQAFNEGLGQGKIELNKFIMTKALNLGRGQVEIKKK